MLEFIRDSLNTLADGRSFQTIGVSGLLVIEKHSLNTLADGRSFQTDFSAKWNNALFGSQYPRRWAVFSDCT